MNYKEIADFIIKEVQEKSTGFQYVVSLKSIIEKTKTVDLTEITVDTIEELMTREEVADVTIDRDLDGLIYGLDVVLYTDHAPNYAGNLEFAVDVCRKCGKLMTEGKLYCKECV